jgi:CheY-like chemotaxis protein
MQHNKYVKSNIENVMVIDDQPNVRESIAETVEDAHYQPIIQNAPFVSLDSCIEKIKNQANAVIVDRHLSQRNYADFDGIQVVKQVYSLFIPILLATSFLNADRFEIQEYKQYLPVILNPSQIEPETIRNGFEICQNEFSGNFLPERKPWRSLICIEEISNDKKSVYVVIPSWNANEKIRLPITMLPSEYKRHLKSDLHFFAQVNLDAERYEDLYFHSFEPLKKLSNKYARFIHS